MFARAYVVCALCVIPALARADSPKLAQARQAIADVRYTEAQALLVAALHDGENSSTAVAEIYQLSARTAAVLHEPDLAEQFYCRWLALEPDARLSDNDAPKLHERFVAAQAFMAAHGRLSVKIAHVGDEIEVVVESDPLTMVAAAALDDGGKPAIVPIAADHRARLAQTIATPRAVVVLDEHGNHLLELAPPPRQDVVGRPPPQPVLVPAPPPRSNESPSLVRRPLVWTVSAAVLAAAGGGFALAASSSQSELTTIVQQSHDHFYGDATTVRDRRDRDALIANVGFAAGAACAITALVMLVLPPHTPVVSLRASPEQVGVAMTRSW